MESRKPRKKRKLGSYPFMSVTFSITLALLVIGLFGLLLVHTNRLTTIIQENVEVQVFLKKDIQSGERNRIQRILTSKRYVPQTDDQRLVRFVSRDEAAEQFIKDTGEDFTQLLGENPLRDLFVLNVGQDYQSVDSLKVIEKELEALTGVYEVSYVESLVRSINQNLTKISVILLGFALILLIVVVILINNTIKLALFSQRFLIRSMQLVGATGRFIKRPFLNRAVLYGALAGLLTSGILYGLYQSALNRMEDLKQLQDEQSILILYGLLVLLGIIVAYLSTLLAIRRYLKTSLDELY
ncbi:MAG: permease-like cell division protein FtsX [Cytophagales bacterium]|nr:permease-like cell division protein FtsX [Cytophagales bacterium]